MTIYLPALKRAALLAAAVALCSCGGGNDPAASVAPPLPVQAGVVHPTRQASSRVTGNVATAIQVYQALAGQAPSYLSLLTYTTQAGSDASAFASALASSFAKTSSDTSLALMVLNNLGVTASTVPAVNAQGQSEYALLLDALGQLFAYHGPAARGQIILNATRLLTGLEADPTYGPVAVNYNNQTWANYSYATNASSQSAAVVPLTTANAGTAQSVLSGASVVLDASASSAASTGSALTYTWILASKPTGSAAVLSSANAVKPSFVADLVGSYVANLVVGEGSVTSGAASVSVSATEVHDSGVAASQCYASGSDALLSCTGTAALALNSAQDGMIGRDVTSASNTDGKLGFSFSVVGSYASSECVKDKLSGLVWEGKTTTGERASSNSYSNYGDSRFGDASTYVTAVNAAKLCGYSNWRLPTRDELQALVDYSVLSPNATIDATWFPNTAAASYWSASSYLGSSAKAWSVSFANGSVSNSARSGKLQLRLVR
jgi:hypothetical protein